MPIVAIQETQNSHKHTSYIGATVLGAIVGHYTKFMLPITPQEKDDRFNGDIKQIGKDARRARQEGINEIKASTDKTPAVDAFIKLCDNNKELSETEIKKLPENIADELIKFKAQINEKVMQAIHAGKKRVITSTKDLRPAYAFILAGAAIGAFTALVKNMANDSKNSNTKYIRYE